MAGLCLAFLKHELSITWRNGCGVDQGVDGNVSGDVFGAQGQGTRSDAAGVLLGTPGITRIPLYILYAKYLLCRVSL
jgi:hypothetical protein